MLNIREGKKEKERDRKRKKKERQKEEQKKKERKKNEINNATALIKSMHAYLTQQNVIQICMDGFEMTQHTTCIHVHVITVEMQFGET